MKKKIIYSIFIISIIFAFSFKSSKEKTKLKDWYGCCSNHYKNKNLNYNCIRTSKKFKSYSKCREAKKSHEKSYSKHKYFCR